MRKGVLLFLLVLVSFLSVRANNVQLQGAVKVISATGSLVTMEVDLSWDNSWRDDNNWDAVWLFFKYKVGADGAWAHAAINTAGATVTGGDYTTMSAMPAATATAQGLFVYPSKNRKGNTGNLKVQVQWAAPHTKAKFDNDEIFVTAHSIEMVYVPYGAYTIGDGSSTGTFTKKVIDSEAVYGTANAAFPKGYQGFYVMKYETSQEEYAEFLNTLTLAQQTALIPGVDKLSKGNFVFGNNKTAPNNRNSIILSHKIKGKPLCFDNNLNNNELYNEDDDGSTLAMNYMSITDACGYASWAGLRPMTEMEYEKACRRPYPQEPEAGEFAWNSATGAVNATGLTMQGSGREIAAIGNVNAEGTVDGPVRCGAFARPTTTNEAAAGATYWGVMEMSGNVRELCANIRNTIISKIVNGTGTYNAGQYGTVPSSYGTRGGGFSDTHTTLTTSSRDAVSRFTNVLQRFSDVGFRCAFTNNAVSVVNAGTIAEDKQPCPGVTVTFSGTPASVAGMTITGYIWSVKIGAAAFAVIPGESRETLTYTNFTDKIAYVFKRKAICPLGDAEVVTESYTVPNTIFFKITPASGELSYCEVSTFTASGVSSYSWATPNGTYTGTKYTPIRSDFNVLGVIPVICTGSISGCSVVKEVQVTVSPIPSTTGCGGTISDNQGNTYSTKLMADNRCWMTQNMRRTDVAYTYSNDSAFNAVEHGCHYDWNIAMQNSTTVGAQGICPVGWHIPCKIEWNTLEMAYGMTKDQADKGNGWRGTDQGTQFKPGGSSGFNLTLSGYNGTSYFGTYGYCWSSSETSPGGYAAWRWGVGSLNATMGCFSTMKTDRFSVRCIRD